MIDKGSMTNKEVAELLQDLYDRGLCGDCGERPRVDYQFDKTAGVEPEYQWDDDYCGQCAAKSIISSIRDDLDWMLVEFDWLLKYLNDGDLTDARRQARKLTRRWPWATQGHDLLELLNDAHGRPTKSQQRRQAEMRATPSWLTDEHRAQILELRAEAQRRQRETGVEHHVDHIVPLRGKGVSGLHVPWNMQVMTADANRRKSNKQRA